MRRSGSCIVLCLLALVWLEIVEQLRAHGAQPDTRTLLPVPYVEQPEDSFWCWAASAEMVMTFYRKPTPQCKLATNYYFIHSCSTTPVVNCCGNNPSLGCFCNGGWPDKALRDNGFTFSVGKKNQCLGWQSLTSEIEAGRPIISSWHYKGEGGHVFVVTGYCIQAGRQMVIINDPIPKGLIGFGQSATIPFSEFQNGKSIGDTHWFDYYNIK